MKELYTYVLDFRGGTYVSQVFAKNLNNSIDEWIKKIEKDKSEIQYLGVKTIEKIKQDFKNPENRAPILLNNLQNVWCFDFNSNQGFGLINVIKTKTIC
ncbi:hypothetical protein [Aureibacter tunicatorum]|uniref:Uncharacterized protein n=1 Tax=Aureibacter tunicatorum TaxID=866807 RepID=A0AAE3XT24_9BACT|nr:hypothetical protein [Aureibacter tunicatorum]MDR6241114.1 hypothetical protein [Aureibacter tunicatorum]BDD03892.1 hypothetical protein AUTU_13750 [Aureibacter tunicatorum]